MQRKTPLKARNTIENRLWARLKALEGYRFRRKSPFKAFTLDFVEHDVGLVVLLEDGEPGRQRTGSIVRDRLLSERGYVILRLWRQEAERDLHAAVHRIRSVLDDLAEDSEKAATRSPNDGMSGLE
jgi:very-short-patch-repair endonuclease